MNATTKAFTEALKTHGCHAIGEKSLAVNGNGDLSNAKQAQEWFEARSEERATGWAQFSGVNLWVERGQPVGNPEGILIAAELHVANDSGGVSHHLRHNGERWIATMITRIDKPAAFLETRALLHVDQKTLLTYEVAWEADEGNGHALRPVAFRFIEKAGP